MAKHIQNAVKFGVPVVVAINKFAYVQIMRYSDILGPILMLSSKLFDLLLSKPVQMLPSRPSTGVKAEKALSRLPPWSSTHALPTARVSATCTI
jgi:hypothetical protein